MCRRHATCRQLPIQNSRLRFCIIAVWVPAASSWQFCQLWGMPFGFKGAVLYFKKSQRRPCGHQS